MNKEKCSRCEVIYDIRDFREIEGMFVCDFCSTKKEKEKADKG